MLEFLARFLTRDRGGSKLVAKERLRLVLVHDRVSAAPQLLEALKEDLIRVIREYIEIDEGALEVSYSSMDNTVALVANIPVLKLRKAIS
ncbi:MAG: cell division topological specificity factor MinE [Candidatus Saccharibacteria bacterium]